ncbi:MAG TPA: hypothetical protein VII01_13050 [Solirubrobacteraceae bacterium]
MLVDHHLALLHDAGLDRCQEGIVQDEEWTVGVVPVQSGLFVGWLDCEWQEPHTPVSLLRGVEHLPSHHAEDALPAALARARRKRARAMRTCRRCGERFVRGHIGPTSCHGCMEKHERVTF